MYMAISKKTQKTIIIIISIILLVLIIVGISIALYFLLRKPSNPPSPPNSPFIDVSPAYSPQQPLLSSSPPGLWYAYEPPGFQNNEYAAEYCQQFGSQLATSDQLNEAANANWGNNCNEGVAIDDGNQITGQIQLSTVCPGEQPGIGWIPSTTNPDELGVYCAGPIPEFMYNSQSQNTSCSNISTLTPGQQTYCYIQT